MLLAVAHGTRSPEGQTQIRALLAAVARRRPRMPLRLSYLDVQNPRLPTVAAALDGPAVVVPLLLSAGYHVRADIPAALGAAEAVVTPPLGPDPLLVAVLLRQLAQLPRADAVVLAAAGSRDLRSRVEVEDVARALGRRLACPVRVAYASSAPRVAEVVGGLRAAGVRRVAVAAYLLADGRFYAGLRAAGADVVTRPLATEAAVVDLVLARYDAAVVRPAEVAVG